MVKYVMHRKVDGVFYARKGDAGPSGAYTTSLLSEATIYNHLNPWASSPIVAAWEAIPVRVKVTYLEDEN